MELLVIGYICFSVNLIQVINFKINYFKHQATCLDYSTGHYAFGSFPLYEYEIIENGEKTKRVDVYILFIYFDGNNI